LTAVVAWWHGGALPPSKPDRSKSTVYWPEPVYETLRRRAFDERTSINKLVIAAVEKYLATGRTKRPVARTPRS
jgi:hypothetical protein